MAKKSPTHFFKTPVKKATVNTLMDAIETEEITSLFASPENTNLENEKTSVLRLLKNKIPKVHFKKISLPTLPKLSFGNMSIKKIWIGLSAPAFAMAAVAFLIYPTKIAPNIQTKYSIYASTPLVMGASDYKIYSKDSRAQRINEVLREYNCPLEGMGEVFVYQADKHHIPWWIVPAISFQESSCGKKTPEKKGVESYNAWGWAVYGDNIQMFDDWVHGIETVSAYLDSRFFSKGITEPCDIMKTYTPPSKGSWCEGVNYFKDIIVNYQTPNQ